MVTPSVGTGLVALDGSTRRAFPRLYLKLVDLRAAVEAGERDSIDEITETLALTRQCGYRSLESLALALLARWLDRTGSHDEAQRHALSAWEILVDLGDAFMAHDLFYRAREHAREFGAVDLDAAFFTALYRSLSARFPNALLVAAPGDREQDAFWRRTLRRCVAGDASWSAQDDAFVARLVKNVDAGACHKQRAAFVRAAAKDLASLLPASERGAFAANLTRRLQAFYERLPGRDARTKRPHF